MGGAFSAGGEMIGGVVCAGGVAYGGVSVWMGVACSVGGAPEMGWGHTHGTRVGGASRVGGALRWAWPPCWAWPQVWGQPYGAASPHRMAPSGAAPPCALTLLSRPHSFTPLWGRHRAMGSALWGHPGGPCQLGPTWGSPRRCGAGGRRTVTFVTEPRSPVSMGPLESWRW